MASRRTKVLFLGAGVALLLLLLTIPSWAQEAVEPQGELATAECYGHHKQEGFRSMDLFPQSITEVPKGQAFTFKLTIKNPWLADLKNTVGYVNISGAPGLSFPGAKDPTSASLNGTVSNGGSTNMPIPVEANATSILVTLAGTPAGTPLDSRVNTADYALTVESPDGTVKIGDKGTGNVGQPPAGRTSRTVVVDQANLTKAGAGAWKAIVSYSGVQPQGAFKLAATTYYNLSQSSELAMPGPALLKPGESYTFTFTILAHDASQLQNLRYGGRTTSYHQHTDRATGDNGDYDKWNTMPLQLGSTLVIGSATVTDTSSVSLLEPVLRRWGQVIGFWGAFLVIPSLVFGGTFGKSTVQPLNTLLGSPRRRVLFHNSMSFWLLGISILHTLIFFYEAFWPWSVGLVWGGLSLAAMVGLAVTGATQRQFVARWGFARWRFVHFAMGILVFVFVLIHIMVDGSHFAAIRTFFFGVNPSKTGM